MERTLTDNISFHLHFYMNPKVQANAEFL